MHTVSNRAEEQQSVAMTASPFGLINSKGQIMFASIHIPKCGGMSLRHMLRSGFGDALLEDYGDKVHCYLPEIVEKRRRRKQKLDAQGAAALDSVKVVHGHFYAAKYLDFIPEIEWVTFLRHPETLLPSYFSFLRRKKQGALAEMARSMSTLDEFVSHPWFQNIMTKQIEGLQIKDFAFIGFVETYDDSSRALAKRMNIKYRGFSKNMSREASAKSALGKLSGKPETGGKYPLSSQQLALIRELNKSDIALYQAARQRFSPQSGLTAK